MKKRETKTCTSGRIALLFGAIALIVSVGLLIYYFHMQNILDRVLSQLKEESDAPSSNEASLPISAMQRKPTSNIYDAEALNAEIENLREANANRSQTLKDELIEIREQYLNLSETSIRDRRLRKTIEKHLSELQTEVQALENEVATISMKQTRDVKKLKDNGIKLIENINFLNRTILKQSHRMTTSERHVNQKFQQLHLNLSVPIKENKRTSRREMLRIARQLDKLDRETSRRARQLTSRLRNLQDADSNHSAALLIEAVERMRQDLAIQKQFQVMFNELQANQSEISGQFMNEWNDQNEARMRTVNSLQANVGKLSRIINRLATGWKGDPSTILYKQFHDLVTYQTARARCQGLGGRLAAKVLRDRTLVRDMVRTGYLVKGTYLWIGYDDITIERNWVWSDGGKIDRVTTRWNSGEPNDMGNEDCAAAAPSEGILRLNDLPCWIQRGYLCEVVVY